MINRKKTITGLISVAMCTSLLNSSITPAVEINTNEDIQLNANLNKEDDLDNSNIAKYICDSNDVENLVTSTTEAAITLGTDASTVSDYVNIEQSQNGTITLDEFSSNKEKGYFKYIISPDDGYEIEDVIIDGESIGIYTYYEFENLAESGHTISAVFKKIEKHATGYIHEFVEVPYVYNKDVNTDLPLKFGLDQATQNDSSYNITEKNYISSVKDQGNLNVCWTFSALGTFESALLKGNNKTDSNTYDFSENHMRYALSSDGANTLGYDRKNYDGGNFTMALAYLTRGKMNGAVNEETDPYPNVTTSAAATATRTFDDISGKTVEDYYPTQVISLGNLPSSTTALEKESRKAEIKNLIMEYGSVTLSYDSETPYYNQYTDANNITTEAYYYPGATTGNTNHAVSIVGWDDDYSIDHFKTGYKPSNPGAFLVKNSWGANWGQNGYFYISYEDKNAFSGINAFKKINSRNFFNNIYEYDTFGRSATASVGNNDAFYANVFNTKKSGLEKLSAISTYCNYPDSYIKLYVSTDGGATFNEKAANSGYDYVAGKGYKIDETGYYTFMLDNPIELNCDKFSVAIEVQHIGDTYLIPLESKSFSNYTSNAIVENGSYTGTSLNNLSNKINLSNKNSLNTCVKAFTEDIIITVDKSGLQTLYDAHKNDVQGNYTNISWNAFTTALNAASTVLEKADVTQSEINTAKSNLESAISGRVENTPVVTVDKSGLQTLYDAHKNDIQGNYTDASWSTFTTALSTASTIIGKADTTQNEVNTAKNNLQLAINGLTKKISGSSVGSGGSGGSSGGGGGGSSSSDSTSLTDDSGTSSSNLSSLNSNISQEISNYINGEIKNSQLIKTYNGNSVLYTEISSSDSQILKVITTGTLSSNTTNITDTISVKASENEQVYTYIESINKYLPMASQKVGDTIKLNVEANKTYVVTTNSLPLVNVGWNKVDTSWYMINANGSMKTGWCMDNGIWYNLSNSGKMNTGWLKDTDGKWYFLKSNGAMGTGWYKDIDSKWYFLKSSGAMASNEYVDGYYLGTNGAWAN